LSSPTQTRIGVWPGAGDAKAVSNDAAVTPARSASITLTWQPSGSTPDQPSPIAPSIDRSMPRS
jgi:hypothetical protein